MLTLGSPPGLSHKHQSDLNRHQFGLAFVTSGLALFAVGSAHLSQVTSQFGLFPTLFLASVLVGCMAMEIASWLGQPQDRT